MFLCSKGAKISEDLEISAGSGSLFLKTFTKCQELSGLRDGEGRLLSSGYHELYSLHGGFMTNINTSALDSFNKLVFQDENAVIHRDSQTSEIKQYGTFNKSNIFRFMRSTSDKAANNEIRAQLLKSLGDAYGLTGAQARADGKITFSADFMKQLENRLGETFKSNDFKIGSDGMVNSGKPLTARRLTAILSKVSEQARAVNTINTLSQRNNGISEQPAVTEAPQPENRSRGFSELKTAAGGADTASLVGASVSQAGNGGITANQKPVQSASENSHEGNGDENEIRRSGAERNILAGGQADRTNSASASGQAPVVNDEHKEAPAQNNAVAADKKDSDLPPGRIAYQDFKNIYTLGRGASDPHYQNRGEFYKALSGQHRDTVFKPFEDMANKLIGKVGAEAVENAVAKINGSFNRENGIFAELFSCMFRPGTEIPLPLQGVSEKKTQNIQEFLKRQLDGIMNECINAHDSGKANEVKEEAVKEAAVNEAPRPPSEPVNSRLFSKMIFEAMPDNSIDGSIVLGALSDPVAHKIIGKLTHEQGPAFVAKHGADKVKAMITAYTGIDRSEFNIPEDIYRGLMNCLFVKGTEGEQKLQALLDRNGTSEELEALIKERLQVLDNYTEHPETIPKTFDAGAAVNKVSQAPSDAERNADRVFKCSVNTAEYKDIGSEGYFVNSFVWLTAPQPVNPQDSLEFVTYVDSEAKSLEDFDIMMQNARGEKLDNFKILKAQEYREVLNQYPKDEDGNPVINRVVGLNVDALKTLSALNDITADFEKAFGKDAVKKVVAEAGGKYNENSRPTLELIKVILTDNDKFSGQRMFFNTDLNHAKYENNLSGVMNIFIDGLDNYVKRLHLQPLNSSGAV